MRLLRLFLAHLRNNHLNEFFDWWLIKSLREDQWLIHQILKA